MIALLVLSAAMISVVTASSVSYRPTVSSSSMHSANGYLYYTKYYHHKKYIYTYSTCSAPPSSIEICLTSLFSEIETGLSSIEATLVKYKTSIEAEMKHEHTLLTSEVSWVSLVESIASSVKSAVDIDYQALVIQVNNLILQKENIEDAYKYAINYLKQIEGLVQIVIKEEGYIAAEYKKVAGEKWSLYSAISAIRYEKLVIQQEQGVIEKVVAKMNVEMSLIANRIYQLNKRQDWLVSWEQRLSVDLSSLESDISEFRDVQKNLYARELSLFAQQNILVKKVQAAESCLSSLESQYAIVQKQLLAIQAYELKVKQVQHSVSEQVSIFSYAYEDFTCEDNLLYYEACSSAAPAAPPKVPVAPPKPVVAPIKPAPVKPAPVKPAPVKPAPVKPPVKPTPPKKGPVLAV